MISTEQQANAQRIVALADAFGHLYVNEYGQTLEKVAAFGFYETPRVCECGFETYSRALYWECRSQHEAEREQKDETGPKEQPKP